MTAPRPNVTVTIDSNVSVEIEGRGVYTSDVDLFAARLAQPRAQLKSELIERLNGDLARGEATTLRRLSNPGLAGMLADFDTAARLNEYAATYLV